MTNRSYYSSSISIFLTQSVEEILGIIQQPHTQDIVPQQTYAWTEQITILQRELSSITEGEIYFELLIPRMGKRADVVVLHQNIIFVLEFKVGEKSYKASDLRQAHDYALDLSYFHEGSHNRVIIPLLVATKANDNYLTLTNPKDKVYHPLKTNENGITIAIRNCSAQLNNLDSLDSQKWFNSSYKPTPSIIEAAQALYAKHKVEDISRNDAGGTNISKTSKRLKEIIHFSNTNQRKSICFVTGVPGAGKTLVGLDIATSNSNPEDDEHAVFLSGNVPLVEVLIEALAKDQKNRNKSIIIGEARTEAKAFIQKIHHFRNEALNETNPPIEKVTIFDEAQRAWDEKKTSDFMKRHGKPELNKSEPNFLIEVMDRHDDWCVIIALIGGGQEIHDGEAGLTEWIRSLGDNFSSWDVYYSRKLNQEEYAGNIDLSLLEKLKNTHVENDLHLDTSMRSFRASNLSNMIHHVIANNSQEAKHYFEKFKLIYPIKITRKLEAAKEWVSKQSRGNETKGILASSKAKRLKPEGIFVNNEIKPSDYFLNDRHDVRSCHSLEDVASEFQVQGLELDWCLVCWDANLRYTNNEFKHWKFRGTRWENINNPRDKQYLENSYRVLLTRARQGMVIYIPLGSDSDKTRKPAYYDETYDYLIKCGLEPLND